MKTLFFSLFCLSSLFFGTAFAQAPQARTTIVIEQNFGKLETLKDLKAGFREVREEFNPHLNNTPRQEYMVSVYKNNVKICECVKDKFFFSPTGEYVVYQKEKPEDLNDSEVFLLDTQTLKKVKLDIPIFGGISQVEWSAEGDVSIHPVKPTKRHWLPPEAPIPVWTFNIFKLTGQ